LRRASTDREEADMIRRILSLTLFTALTCAASGTAGAEDGPARTLQRALDDLEVMEALLAGKVSEATRRELLSKLQDVREDVREVQQQLLRDPGSEPLAGVGPLVSITMEVPIDEPVELGDEPVAEPTPLTEADFLPLLGAVEDEPFEDGKLGVLRDACRHRHFTAEQVGRLVGAFSFSDGKVEAAVMLYSRTVDPENFYRVYGSFDFDGDQEEVRRRLGL